MRHDSASISANACEELVAKLKPLELWSSSSKPLTAAGLDGAQWIFEGLREGRYAVREVWTPTDKGEDAVFRSAGLAFLVGAGLKPPASDTY
jgi:hypothetical protein